jgi:glyoxylate utilization-related uncharacterized protein
MAVAKLIKIAELQSLLPPKHTNTHAFTIIDKSSVGAQEFEMFLTEIHPGGEAQEDLHPASEHAIFVISGVGEAIVEGENFIVNPSECLYLPPGTRHSMRPVGG